MSAAEVIAIEARRARRLLDELPAAVAEGLGPNVARIYRFLAPDPAFPWVEAQSLDGRDANPRFAVSRFAHARSAAELQALAEKAESSHHAQGVYVIANRIDPAVTTREESRQQWGPSQKGASTTDGDISARMALYIDPDAERVRRTSATDEEKEHARAVAGRVLELAAESLPLASLGVGDSGNGYSILVALDALPNTPEVENEIGGALAAMDHLLTTDRAKIDRSVKDAKRLVPLFGTMKRKGAPGIPERPHRRTAFVCAPEVVRVGLADLTRFVDALADRLTPSQRAEVDKARGRKPQKLSEPTTTGDKPFDRANAVPTADVLGWLGYMNGDAPVCPGCRSQDSGVAIVRGGLKCSHDRCSQKGVAKGFRTNVDLVAEAHGVAPRDAVGLLAERFGFEGFAARTATSTASTALAEPGKPFELVGPGHGLWAPLEPITYVIGGLVPHASVSLLAGYSSSLKSWLAADMAVSVGAGRPWLGHAPFATERAPVTYMEKEAGLYEMRRRLHAIRQPLDMAEDPLLDVCSFPANGNVFDPEFRKRLADLAAQRTLIVIDTLAAFSFGADENTAQMAEGVGLFAEIAAKTRCAFVVVAHEKKKGNNGGEIDPRERVRGSSAIFGAVDCVFSCQREKVRAPVLVEQTKARNGREAQPFIVEMLDSPHGGVTFDVRTKEDPKPPTPEEQYRALVDSVVECIARNPQSSTEAIRLRVGMRKTNLLDVLQVAADAGRIRNIGDSKRARWVAGGGRHDQQY